MQKMAKEPDRSDALSLLRTALDDPAASFHEGQWEAIDALVNRRARLLVVQRTGWGKSSVYFIATRMLRDRGRGSTLIISPLLALMRNQVEAAKRLGVQARTVNSSNREEWPVFEEEMRLDKMDALLASPELLESDDFVSSFLTPFTRKIGLFVVDEAHCISDWGHDFRPDYRRLVNVLQQMPGNVAILGTTATANNRVVDDVQEQLGDIGIQRGPLMRRTLALQTLRLRTQAERLAWLAEHLGDLPGTGIIYTLTKRDANQVNQWLSARGYTTKAYYAGVVGDGYNDSSEYRKHLEGKLLKNEIKALVATTALGMGYDKPDLGFVVHYQAPSSVIAYYQQVGRAGRGVDRAIGILMSGAEDGAIQNHFRENAFPDESLVLKVLNALDDSEGLGVRQLEERANLGNGRIKQILKYLSVHNPAPIIKSGPRWMRTPVPFRMDHEAIQRLSRQREIEWRELQSYVDEPGCLMEFLARALDDVDPQPCGKCASCLGHPVVDPGFSPQEVATAQHFLRHVELPLECNKQVAAGAFRKYDFRGNLPPALRAKTGRILSRWRDAGWGTTVAADKHKGSFRDELVEAVFEMVSWWGPDPAPTWATCIPSQNHLDLVPDFSKRLARRLGILFKPVLKKIEANEPQKTQQNRFHQCRNLDGVFGIEGEVPNGPVLLIDDVVDSGWTLTVAAALLRDSGSGPVWPVALATSGREA